MRLKLFTLLYSILFVITLHSESLAFERVYINGFGYGFVDLDNPEYVYPDNQPIGGRSCPHEGNYFNHVSYKALNCIVSLDEDGIMRSHGTASYRIYPSCPVGYEQTEEGECVLPCKEEGEPPVSPWTPIIFNYEPNEDNKIVYPFSMDDFCTILGDPSRDNLPPQYKKDLIYCYYEPCQSIQNEGLPYGQLDLTYTPEVDTNGNGTPDKCDPKSDRYKEYDCDGDGEPNENDPEADNDGDGYSNGCDDKHSYFESFDCDGDGENNWKDTDTDGDGVPNDFDEDPKQARNPAEMYEIPNCAELKAVEELNCPFNQHNWDCEDDPTTYIKQNSCRDIFHSPCDDYRVKLESSCKDGYHIEGGCSDNSIDITSNTLKCLPTPDSIPNCRASDNKQLNLMEDGCECMDGYTINSFGNCWQSDLDDNATAQQRQVEMQKQAQQNEEIENRNKQEIQQKAEANNTNNQLSSLNTQASTLAGIRKDINETNALLSRMLENGGDGGSDDDGDGEDTEISEDAEILDLLNQKKDIFDNMIEQYTTFGINVTNQYNEIESKFEETKSLFSAEHTFDVSSGSTSNCFSFVVFGTYINIDLCTSFSMLAPIVYFVMTLVFMILTFQFLVTHILKGLE